MGVNDRKDGSHGIVMLFIGLQVVAKIQRRAAIESPKANFVLEG
jgi:hypothetical protein